MTRPKLNKLLKWRSILIGRIIGSRSIDDPQAIGMRDIIDKLLILRVENTVIMNLLIRKGITSPSVIYDQMEQEAEELDKIYEGIFPGMRTTDYGVEVFDKELAAKTMEGWPS